MEFIQALMELGGGQVAHDVNENLRKVLEAVRETGKKGKLTLSIDVSPQKVESHKVTQVKLTGTCKIVEPVVQPDQTIFYVLDNGSLSRSDPKQAAMEFEMAQVRKEVKG